MRSAFGVDHGEVSKGVPKGLAAVAAKYPREPLVNPNKQVAYAHERMVAHKQGKSVIGVKEHKAAGLGQANFPHFINETKTRGRRARARSRLLSP